MSSLADNNEFLFGYGSLVDGAISLPGRSSSAAGFIADLRDYERTWNIAMDNSVDLPGYKYYAGSVPGARPAVFVTFLNVAVAIGKSVNGVCLPVTHDRWALLKRRERNYERVEVTDRIEPSPPGRVWCYVGTEDARARFERGLATGTAVVARGYLDDVRRGFRAVGQSELEKFDATTRPPACPVRVLQRVDLP